MSFRIGQASDLRLDVDQISVEQDVGKATPGGLTDGVDQVSDLALLDEPTVLYRGSGAPRGAPANPPPANPPPANPPPNGEKGGSEPGKPGEKTEGASTLGDKIKEIASRIGPNGIDVGGGVTIGGSLSPPMVKVTVPF